LKKRGTEWKGKVSPRKWFVLDSKSKRTLPEVTKDKERRGEGKGKKGEPRKKKDAAGERGGGVAAKMEKLGVNQGRCLRRHHLTAPGGRGKGEGKKKKKRDRAQEAETDPVQRKGA